MGGSTSTLASAESCVMNKKTFNEKIDIIRDAHSLMQYYGSLLLAVRMPIKLDEYRQYSRVSEDYFNTRRKDTISDLQAINPAFNNYYDFYKALGVLQIEYERNDITEADRKKKLESVFNASYVVLKLLIEELWESCDGKKAGASSAPSDTDTTSSGR